MHQIERDLLKLEAAARRLARVAAMDPTNYGAKWHRVVCRVYGQGPARPRNVPGGGYQPGGSVLALAHGEYRPGDPPVAISDLLGPVPTELISAAPRSLPSWQYPDAPAALPFGPSPRDAFMYEAGMARHRALALARWALLRLADARASLPLIELGSPGSKHTPVRCQGGTYKDWPNAQAEMLRAWAEGAPAPVKSRRTAALLREQLEANFQGQDCAPVPAGRNGGKRNAGGRYHPPAFLAGRIKKSSFTS